MRRRNVSVVGPQEDDPIVSTEGVGRIEPVPAPAPAPQAESYANLGEHVASVLRAAEDAAEQIKADAQLAAEEVVQGAQRVRREAEEYAEDIRVAVESYANQQRREAEEEARRATAGAEAEARALREAAQEMARGLEGETERRREQLREDTRDLEDRRKRALDDLREIALGLQDVLSTSARTARTAVRSTTRSRSPAGADSHRLHRGRRLRPGRCPHRLGARLGRGAKPADASSAAAAPASRPSWT